MTDHTPEPWEAYNSGLSINNGQRHVGHCEDVEDAARIVACVNACADIPTEQLELGAIWKLAQAARNTLEPLPPAQARGALQVLRDALAPFFQKD